MYALFFAADPVRAIPTAARALAPALGRTVAVPGLSPRAIADTIVTDAQMYLDRAQRFDAPKVLSQLSDKLFPEAPPPPPVPDILVKARKERKESKEKRPPPEAKTFTAPRRPLGKFGALGVLALFAAILVAVAFAVLAP
jgi:hypothetical protein